MEDHYNYHTDARLKNNDILADKNIRFYKKFDTILKDIIKRL